MEKLCPPKVLMFLGERFSPPKCLKLVWDVESEDDRIRAPDSGTKVTPSHITKQGSLGRAVTIWNSSLKLGNAIHALPKIPVVNSFSYYR